jgi:hypothetical protein
MQPITLYLKPYVRKFIIKTYGKEPVYIRADSDIGKLFRLAIARDNYLPLAALEVEENFSTERRSNKLEKLKFALSFRISQGKLTHENLVRLTQAVENEFEKAMYFYVRGMRQVHVSESSGVKRFLEDIGIEDEKAFGLNQAAAIKMVQRSRKAKEENDYFPANSVLNV